jgi:hypothetical protein
MDARVVVFPLPVGPVTKNNPLGLRHNAAQIFGNPISSKLSNLDGILRKTIEILPF